MNYDEFDDEQPDLRPDDFIEAGDFEVADDFGDDEFIEPLVRGLMIFHVHDVNAFRQTHQAIFDRLIESGVEVMVVPMHGPHDGISVKTEFFNFG